MGALTILLAMLVVVVLAGAALKQYGLTGSAARAPTRDPGVDAAGAGAQAVEPTPRNAIESAKAVEATVQRQADEIAKKIDDATR